MLRQASGEAFPKGIGQCDQGSRAQGGLPSGEGTQDGGNTATAKSIEEHLVAPKLYVAAGSR